MTHIDLARAALDRAEQALPEPGRALPAIEDAIVELFRLRGMLTFDADRRDWFSPSTAPPGWTPGDPYGIYTPAVKR